MASTTPVSRRAHRFLLGAAALLVALSACSDDGDSSAGPTTSASADAGTATPTSGSAATGSPGTATPTDTGVNCSGNSCSVTVSGHAQVEVLGTTIRLGAVQDGQATFGIGDRQVSCRQGDSVSAGPLRLQCTTVTPDSVTFTASLG